MRALLAGLSSMGGLVLCGCTLVTNYDALRDGLGGGSSSATSSASQSGTNGSGGGAGGDGTGGAGTGGAGTGAAGTGTTTSAGGSGGGGGGQVTMGGLVPDNATTFCSDATAAVACPAMGDSGYGQDGNFLINVPVYVAGAFTALDPVTGLTWQRDPAPGYLMWDEATQYCAGLNLTGETDWRLPTRIEALTLMDHGRTGSPKISVAAFGSFISEAYWTSSSYVNNAGYKWLAAFNVGKLVGDFTTGGSAHKAFCVRGQQPSGIIVPSVDTAFDERTGLTWQRSVPPTLKDWLASLDYCQQLSGLGGYDDWRLPSLHELGTLVDEDVSQPAIDSAIFPNTTNGGYWSSTPNTDDPTKAYTVEFYDGYVEISLATNTKYARCVRSGS